MFGMSEVKKLIKKFWLPVLIFWTIILIIGAVLVSPSGPSTAGAKAGGSIMIIFGVIQMVVQIMGRVAIEFL